MKKSGVAEYRRGFQAGVAACAAFLTDAADEPTLAGELIEYVRPGRNWRLRFRAAVAESQRRWDEGMARVKEQRARMTPEELEEAANPSWSSPRGSQQDDEPTE